MSQRPGFPPGLSWLPIGIAVLVMVGASLGAMVPHFRTQFVRAGAPGSTASAEGPAGISGPTATGSRVLVPGQAAVAGNTGGPPGTQGQYNCAKGQNAGNTAPGVTGTEIHVASTIVTTGVGKGFLGEAVYGIQAAIKLANSSGGICGRVVTLQTDNSGWASDVGQGEIDNYIHQGNVFALVGEPDSEGLDAAVRAKDIDNAGIPVVGTDGMLSSQYTDPWVWPVAASTVTNMHIIVDYAYHTLGARSFGIVFDNKYKFGIEGAYAFDQEVRRLTGADVPGYSSGSRSCIQAYCGVPIDSGDFSSNVTQFNSACSNPKPCDLVVALLEPGPMETWMKQEENNSRPWYKHLMGGEPLFDDNVGTNCTGCAGEQGQGAMGVWTGYRPAIQPFDSEPAVNTYKNALLSVCPHCDPHNEFTEGAYIGTMLFLEAARRVGPVLTRDALRQELDSATFNLGLTVPLSYPSLPHIANDSMAGFAVNSTGSTFNGWTYVTTGGFLSDPARGRDFNGQ